jgi:hypothetical protein
MYRTVSVRIAGLRLASSSETLQFVSQCTYFGTILITALGYDKQSSVGNRGNSLRLEVTKVLPERCQVKGLLPSLVHFSGKNATIETRQLGKKSQAG